MPDHLQRQVNDLEKMAARQLAALERIATALEMIRKDVTGVDFAFMHKGPKST